MSNMLSLIEGSDVFGNRVITKKNKENSDEVICLIQNCKALVHAHRFLLQRISPQFSHLLLLKREPEYRLVAQYHPDCE